jgi:hypothetical protein
MSVIFLKLSSLIPAAATNPHFHFSVCLGFFSVGTFERLLHFYAFLGLCISIASTYDHDYDLDDDCLRQLVGIEQNR